MEKEKGERTRKKDTLSMQEPEKTRGGGHTADLHSFDITML